MAKTTTLGRYAADHPQVSIVAAKRLYHRENRTQAFFFNLTSSTHSKISFALTWNADHFQQTEVIIIATNSRRIPCNFEFFIVRNTVLLKFATNASNI
jgi:hypothetical protein